MLGEALSKNPGRIKLRMIWAAQNISKTIVTSRNPVYLTANNPVLNLQDASFTRGSDSLIKAQPYPAPVSCDGPLHQYPEPLLD
ncbi:Prohibitin-2, subunit of the prohibitin complex (Phb1p-Phb2p) [Saguinus oedipus]|uniref:Prohibitin-2, subunit of the prohibitin complex (Phb1p-Phb2p) n=1 Tax=Saguinus oedipus TaxID=9490 RepID=A0ABQ9UGQ4_SAGOE|nr:Prohibitin-2, subunit of the prohibitin complex (Phb1p-Phb2p) [Saguinus oedipus]